MARSNDERAIRERLLGSELDLNSVSEQTGDSVVDLNSGTVYTIPSPPTRARQGDQFPRALHRDSTTCICAAGVRGALATLLGLLIIGVVARYLGVPYNPLASSDELLDEVTLVQVDSISNPHECSLCVLVVRLCLVLMRCDACRSSTHPSILARTRRPRSPSVQASPLAPFVFSAM